MRSFMNMLGSNLAQRGRVLALLVPAALWGQAQPAQPAPPAIPNAADLMHLMGSDSRSFLGVGVTEVDTERSRQLKLKEEYGVEVTKVEEGSPAEKAGLKPADVVLEYNGLRVEGTEQFVRLVRETPPGRAVRLLVSRNGSAQTLTATLGTRKMKGLESFKLEVPQWEAYVPDVPQAKMSWKSSMLGVEAEALESQLAAYFGVKEGVLVRSVYKGTAAEKAGLKAGDVLLKVDESKVTTPREVTSAVRSARSKDKKTVAVMVMRERKEVSLNVTFEDESSEKTLTPKGRSVSNQQMQL
jgi:serine protease Do